MKKYKLIIVGGGPGGYTAAFRAAELGMSVAIVDDNDLGGVCLNWGCIPTKSLLKNAEVFELINNASSYGTEVGKTKIHFEQYREDRLKEVKSGTVKAELTLIRRVFKTAIKEWGYGILLNPVANIE